MYFGIIYCATLPSNKKYYGFTINFENRKRTHKSNVKKGIINKFYNAIRKYGWDSIIWEIIESYESSSKKELKNILSNREIYWIKESQSYTNGYNNTKGGDGVLGLIWKEKSREKLSKSKLGSIQSQETIEKRRQKQIGREQSEETKKKIGVKNKNNKYCLGIKRSNETKEKMKNSKIGKNNPMYGKIPWNKGKTKIK